MTTSSSGLIQVLCAMENGRQHGQTVIQARGGRESERSGGGAASEDQNLKMVSVFLARQGSQMPASPFRAE